MPRPALTLLISTLAILAQIVTISAQSIYRGNSKWSYYGCYKETTTLNNTGGVHALPGATETDTHNMTVPVCQDFCAGNRFGFAGLEYTNECYCGFSINSFATKVDDSECNLACVGNGTQICGGSLRLSVYNTTLNAKNAAGMGVGEVKTKVGSVLALSVAVGLLCLMG